MELGKEVKIRGKGLTVSNALQRSLAQVAYYVGQIVLIARTHLAKNWEWLSISPGRAKSTI
ncbi:MAG: DUF1572 family protein [Acidobacteriota bacterium]